MRRMLLLATMAMIGPAAGCRTIGRGITENVLERGPAKQWQVHYSSRIKYTLTDASLTDVEFEGSKLSGDVVARYQRGLGPQAQCLADGTTDLIGQVHERTGVDISTRMTMYLLRFDQRPQDFDIMLSVEPNEFPLPLFIRSGSESCEAIVAQNPMYPYLTIHELVESSLVSRTGGQVLPDLSWGAMGLSFHINNYTRWFRDGLANYAGYVAYEILSPQIPSELRLPQTQMFIHDHPFTSLARIGDKLFSWPQLPATKEELAYYNAALGLFLLIADTYGEQTIRYMVDEIAARETVDGDDLIEIADRVLGTDVRRLAGEFKFPTLGIEAARMSPALALNRGVDLREGVFVAAVKDGSAAKKAGLQEKDVITAVGDTPVANLLDFELGLFRARRQPFASLAVRRQNAAPLTIEMPLEVSDTSGNAPRDERSRSLIAGEVGVTYQTQHF